MLDQVVDILVVEVLRHERQILRRLALHLGLEKLLEQADIFDDRVDFVAVERQRLLQLVEDAHEVEHEAVRLDHLLPLVLVGRFTRAIACSSVWSRIGLSRYIAYRIGASNPVRSFSVTIRIFG